MITRGNRWLAAVGLWGLVLSACSKKKEDAAGDAGATPTASASAEPVAFDIEGFCDQTMGLGRPCEGDDELMEGNKIGLCSTTLRAARDDEGVKLDPAQGAACKAEVKAADPPLPDVRTLTTIAQRFSSCRGLLRPVPSLSKVEAVEPGTAAAGEACKVTGDCAHRLYCEAGSCAPKKKAGEACHSGQECIGRCSRKAGRICVPYCGAG